MGKQVLRVLQVVRKVLRITRRVVQLPRVIMGSSNLITLVLMYCKSKSLIV